MPRENIHYGGWEHRDLHNINGMLFVGACLPIISVWRLMTSFSGELDLTSCHSTDGSTKTPVRPDAFLLRWFSTLRRDVDRRQPWHLGAYGRWREDGPGKQYRRLQLLWMCVNP